MESVTMSKVTDMLTRLDHVDKGGEPPDDGGMEDRLKKLEILAEKTADRLIVIERDIAVIKASGATKSDIAECKATIAEAKTAIILWVVGAIFLAQGLPIIKSLVETSLK